MKARLMLARKQKYTMNAIPKTNASAACRYVSGSFLSSNSDGSPKILNRTCLRCLRAVYIAKMKIASHAP